MADVKNEEQRTKSTPLAAQGATNEGELPQQTDSTVGAVAETSAKGKEAIIYEESSETTSSDEETTETTSSSDEGALETTSSDDESEDATHADSHGQTQPYQLGAKPNDDEIGGTTNLSSSASSSKRRRPPLPQSLIRAKIQAVMTNDDEHRSGRLHDVPLVLATPSLTPTAAGLPPSSGHDPGYWSGNYGRRYSDMLNEMLASVLIKLLQQMPLASTNGGIPDGVITRGFLYTYSNGPEIICACHGQFFNAIEFVKHAGGLEVENPSGLINLEFFPTPQSDV